MTFSIHSVTSKASMSANEPSSALRFLPQSQPDTLTQYQNADQEKGLCARIADFLRRILDFFCKCCCGERRVSPREPQSIPEAPARPQVQPRRQVHHRRFELPVEEVEVVPPERATMIMPNSVATRMQRDRILNPRHPNGDLVTVSYEDFLDPSRLTHPLMLGIDRRGGLKFFTLKLRDLQTNEVFVQILRELPPISRETVEETEAASGEDHAQMREVSSSTQPHLWGYFPREGSIFERLGMGNADQEVPYLDAQGRPYNYRTLPFTPFIREIMEGRHLRFRMVED